MRVRWTMDAADDLERICDYIAQDRPESARRVAQSIVARIGTLEMFPHLGHPGRVKGTQEIAFPRYRSLQSTKFLTLRQRCRCCVSFTAANVGPSVDRSRQSPMRFQLAG